MDAISQYKEIVRNLIMEYAGYKPSHGEIETEVIIIPDKGHYELIRLGWNGVHRVHYVAIHIDIIGDKVWIQHNGTSVGIADELVEAGIPRDHIVLAFHPAHLRQHTGFATA